LSLEPLSKVFHARAMRVYAAQDRRDAVVAQYREATRRLEAEDFDSTGELRALVSKLLEHDSRDRSLDDRSMGPRSVADQPNRV
jgi:hypothetical protein